MRVTVDPEVNAGYIYLVPIQKGEAVEQVVVEGKFMILDFNKRGQLLGIEFLDTFRMPPFAKSLRKRRTQIIRRSGGGRPERAML